MLFHHAKAGRRARSLRDVPARSLAFRFEPDVGPPPGARAEEADDKIESIQIDFNTRRENDALVRTVRSPDGQRALVLYGVADESSQEFHIDLYSSDGKFLRNLTPPDLSCVFPETVAWSPDGNFITFIGHKTTKPTPTSHRPAPCRRKQRKLRRCLRWLRHFRPVPVFSTEQISHLQS